MEPVVLELEEALVSTWVMFPMPLFPNRSHVMFMPAAPSDNPAKVIPVTLVAGLTKLPLASKEREPVAFADATGS